MSQPKFPLKFIKCHTNGNDFLIISQLQSGDSPIVNPQLLARQICNRRTGIGADGLILTSPVENVTSGDVVTVNLWNSDGSKAEISGNGTCCVAAVVAFKGRIDSDGVDGEGGWFIADTGAGGREVRFRRGGYGFVVDMGVPSLHGDGDEWVVELEASGWLVEATVLNVGNPQCALFYEDKTIPEDWKEVSRQVAADAERFPEGVNVSFSRVVDRNTLQTAFYERGAGETSSSGTGSIGAAVSAIVRGFTESPVTVQTMSGQLKVRWDGPGNKVELEGHAEVVGEGTFFALVDKMEEAK